MKYRQDVDGLRAIAVGAVLLMHGFHDTFPNGFLGVDVFFAISGFVITLSLLGRKSNSFGDFIAGFYARRFLRLLPALVLVLVVTSLLIGLFNPRPYDSLKTALAASFGLANIQLFLAQQDYFSPAAALNPFTHTWSLGVEEQFYLVVPLLMWAALAYWGLRHYFVILTGLLVVSLAAWILTTGVNADAAFYLVPYRFWELAAGCLVAVFLSRRARRQGERNATADAPGDASGETPDSAHPVWSGLLGALAVPVMVVLLLVPVELPLIPTTIAVVVCTCVALLADTSGQWTGRVLISAPFNFVGRASYSIYLWHWPVLVLALWSIGDGTLTTIALLGLSVLLGWLTMIFVEQPVRFGFRGRNRNALLSGFAMMAVGAVVPVALGMTKPDLYLGKAPDMIALGTPSLFAPHQPETPTASPVSWEGRACILSNDSEIGKQIDTARCSFGNPETAARRIQVFGNSYSASFVQAFPLIAEQLDALVTLTSSWGASPVAGLPNDTPWAGANEYYWQSLVPAMTADLSEGDHVMLLSDLSGFSEISGRQPDYSLEALETGLRDFSARMAGNGIGVSILGPLPYARDAQCDPAMAVPQWYAPNGGPCLFFSREDTLAAQADLRGMLQSLQDEGVLGVITLDDVFCPGPECSYFGTDGLILYRDQYSHPSVEAAIASADLIATGITR